MEVKVKLKAFQNIQRKNLNKLKTFTIVFAGLYLGEFISSSLRKWLLNKIADIYFFAQLLCFFFAVEKLLVVAVLLVRTILHLYVSQFSA